MRTGFTTDSEIAGSSIKSTINRGLRNLHKHKSQQGVTLSLAFSLRHSLLTLQAWTTGCLDLFQLSKRIRFDASPRDHMTAAYARTPLTYRTIPSLRAPIRPRRQRTLGRSLSLRNWHNFDSSNPPQMWPTKATRPISASLNFTQRAKHHAAPPVHNTIHERPHRYSAHHSRWRPPFKSTISSAQSEQLAEFHCDQFRRLATSIEYAAASHRDV
jgi:hypothetical protein